MQVMCLTGEPVQHPGRVGRELPLVKSLLFTAEEADKMFQAAMIVEKLFHNLFRMNSVEEAYAELEAEIIGIKGPNPERDRRIIRRVRSYILEYDIFLKHWEKYFAGHVKNGKQKYKDIVSNMFDNNETYALICTLRNYLVRSEDIVHRQHIGLDGFGIWADRDRIIQDMDWPKAKRKLLNRQPGKIDILRMIDDSLTPIMDVHDRLMYCQLTDKVKESCEYLNFMFGRTLPVKSTACCALTIAVKKWFSQSWFYVACEYVDAKGAISDGT